MWKNESKVILCLKFQNLSLIGSLKKKKAVLLLQVPEHLSFGLFLNEKEWGGRQLPITESLLRAEFFACIIFVSMQRSSFSPPALFLLQKLQLFLYILPMFLSSFIFWSTLFFLQMDSSWSISSLFSPVLFVSRCGFWSACIPVIEQSLSIHQFCFLPVQN